MTANTNKIPQGYYALSKLPGSAFLPISPNDPKYRRLQQEELLASKLNSNTQSSDSNVLDRTRLSDENDINYTKSAAERLFSNTISKLDKTIAMSFVNFLTRHGFYAGIPDDKKLAITHTRSLKMDLIPYLRDPGTKEDQVADAINFYNEYNLMDEPFSGTYSIRERLIQMGDYKGIQKILNSHANTGIPFKETRNLRQVKFAPNNNEPAKIKIIDMLTEGKRIVGNLTKEFDEAEESYETTQLNVENESDDSESDDDVSDPIEELDFRFFTDDRVDDESMKMINFTDEGNIQTAQLMIDELPTQTMDQRAFQHWYTDYRETEGYLTYTDEMDFEEKTYLRSDIDSFKKRALKIYNLDDTPLGLYHIERLAHEQLSDITEIQEDLLEELNLESLQKERDSRVCEVYWDVLGGINSKPRATRRRRAVRNICEVAIIENLAREREIELTPAEIE